MEFMPEQTVYLRDGREAVYVMQNGEQHLVRVLMKFEGGYDDPPYSIPDDKITAVAGVYSTPPVAVVSAEVLAEQERLAKVRKQVGEAKAELREMERGRREMEAAAKKYPSIQQALDFIEGRITHVVILEGYGVAQIKALPEALEMWPHSSRRGCMKLLCLFGTDEYGNQEWSLNQYRDGSGGSWTQILPCKSEAEARKLLQSLVNDAVAAWQLDPKSRPDFDIGSTLKAQPWLTVSPAWTDHQDKLHQERLDARITKLREELATLEGG